MINDIYSSQLCTHLKFGGSVIKEETILDLYRCCHRETSSVTWESNLARLSIKLEIYIFLDLPLPLISLCRIESRCIHKEMYRNTVVLFVIEKLEATECSSVEEQMIRT